MYTVKLKNNGSHIFNADMKNFQYLQEQMTMVDSISIDNEDFIIFGKLLYNFNIELDVTQMFNLVRNTTNRLTINNTDKNFFIIKEILSNKWLINEEYLETETLEKEEEANLLLINLEKEKELYSNKIASGNSDSYEVKLANFNITRISNKMVLVNRYLENMSKLRGNARTI